MHKRRRALPFPVTNKSAREGCCILAWRLLQVTLTGELATPDNNNRLYREPPTSRPAAVDVAAIMAATNPDRTKRQIEAGETTLHLSPAATSWLPPHHNTKTSSSALDSPSRHLSSYFSAVSAAAAAAAWVISTMRLLTSFRLSAGRGNGRRSFPD